MANGVMGPLSTALLGVRCPLVRWGRRMFGELPGGRINSIDMEGLEFGSTGRLVDGATEVVNGDCDASDESALMLQGIRLSYKRTDLRLFRLVMPLEVDRQAVTSLESAWAQWALMQQHVAGIWARIGVLLSTSYASVLLFNALRARPLGLELHRR